VTRLLPLVLPLMGLLGCTDTWDEHLVYEYMGEGVHEIGPVQTPSLTDTVHVAGELGTASLGGRLRQTSDGLFWQDGGEITLDYVVDDGVFVPMDDQGLVLLSFYHHLAGVRDDLSERGWQSDMDTIFPVTTIAWTPEQLVTAATPVENAAYLSAGVNAFILYEDANNNIPLGAHAGVVRHEFGHAWFQVLMLPVVERALSGDPVVDDLRAINEGFADMVAILSLDDPEAIPFVERNPRLAHTTDGFSGSDDPYSLGVVFAGFAWDARILSDDPEQTLELTIGAVEDFREFLFTEENDGTPQQFGLMLYDRYASEINDFRLCQAWRLRFPDLVGRCGR
jgi:hypothetical protein